MLLPQPAGPPLHVLVVDGYPDLADSYATLLRLHGHHARTALGCVEAEAAASDSPPDLVLLDPYLPDGDGYALAGRLTGLLRLPPAFVAMTCRPGLEEKSRRAGCVAHCIKPVEPLSMVALLEECAARRRQPVLVVDDDPAVRPVLRAAVGRLGYDTLLMGCGAVAGG